MTTEPTTRHPPRHWQAPPWLALALGSIAESPSDTVSSALIAAAASARGLGFSAVTLPLADLLPEVSTRAPEAIAEDLRRQGLLTRALELPLEVVERDPLAIFALCARLACWRLTIEPGAPHLALTAAELGRRLDLLAYRARARSVQLGYRAAATDLAAGAERLAVLTSFWSCRSLDLELDASRLEAAGAAVDSLAASERCAAIRYRPDLAERATPLLARIAPRLGTGDLMLVLEGRPSHDLVASLVASIPSTTGQEAADRERASLFRPVFF